MQESADEFRQRNRMLEDRISKLCAGVLRVSTSLDLETVLREIVDSARELTGARYGMITTVDVTAQAPAELVQLTDEIETGNQRRTNRARNDVERNSEDEQIPEIPTDTGQRGRTQGTTSRPPR